MRKGASDEYLGQVIRGSSLSSLVLSHTHVYEPEIRALLGTASQFCEVVVLTLRTGWPEQVIRKAVGAKYFAHGGKGGMYGIAASNNRPMIKIGG